MSHPLRCTLILALLLATSRAFAATPPAGTVTAASPVASWSSDLVVTQIYDPSADGTSCGGTSNTARCDYYQLTVDAPTSDFGVKIQGVGPIECLCDWDLEVYDPNGQLIGESHKTFYENDTVVLANLPSGTYTVAFILIASFGPSSYTATAELGEGFTPTPGPGAGPDAPVSCEPAASGTLTAANKSDAPLLYAPQGDFQLTMDLPKNYRAEHPHTYLRFEFLGGTGGGQTILAGDATGDPLDAVAHWTSGRTSVDGIDRAYLVPNGGLRQATLTAHGTTTCVRIALVDIPDDPGDRTLPYAATGEGPRFAVYTPRAFPGLGLQFSEPTIGVNPHTGSVFAINTLDVLRVTFDDSTTPAGDTWVSQRAFESSVVSLDPILTVDQTTGRVFSLNLTGPVSSADYSDDDGTTWLPGGNGFPSSGVDHQSLEAGPYPVAGPGALIPHPLYPSAVYYCSQGITNAYCSRSDDGGVTFKPSTILYTNTQCTGLHGHVKVAPDGTVYVPNKTCGVDIPTFGNGHPGLVVSEDAGLTWTVRTVGDDVTNASSHHGDPSVAIGRDNTVYYSYLSVDQRLKVAVTKDRGVTWTNIFDVGAIAGVHAAQFAAVVAGDPGRAAVAFVGTAFPDAPVTVDESLALPLASVAAGNIDFPGNWYGYVATTLDYGATWHVTKVAEGDILQGPGGIGGGGDNRNLLDFNDAFIDPEGRVIAAFADGCIGGCELGYAGNFYGNARVAQLARQTGGPRMYAQFDPVEPARPAPPRLTGYRALDHVVLNLEADGAGLPIDGYDIYRDGVLIAENHEHATYVDMDAHGLVATYRYQARAKNALGTSELGNDYALAPDENAPVTSAVCTVPGQGWLDQVGEPGAEVPSMDLDWLGIAEPEDQPGKLVFTVMAAAPGGSMKLGFDHPNGRRYGITVKPDSTTVGYTDGRWYSDSDSTMNDFLLAMTDVPALDRAEADLGGLYTVVLDKAAWDLHTGDVLRNVTAFGLLPNGSGQVFLRDFLGYDISQPIVGNDFCQRGARLAPPVVAHTPTVTARREDHARFGSGSLPAVTLLGLLLGAALRARSARRVATPC